MTDHKSIEILNSENGEYYFNIMAANNKILATSEMYKSKASAIKGAESVITNILDDVAFYDGRSVPSRGDHGMRISALKRRGINSMIDVAEALIDGDLVFND